MASNGLLGIYHRLPPWAKSIAATARGWKLKRERYGPETERLVAEALSRDSWSAEQWADWRARRLKEVLKRAKAAVPYYKQVWSHRAGNPDILTDWPILEKEPLRANPRDFVAEDCDPRRMVEDHTSGTSGTPLRIWMSRDCARRWYAIYEARCRRWHGVSNQDRWVNIGGQLVVPLSRREPPFWVHNAALRQLYMSSYHLAPDLVPFYLEKLSQFQPSFLLGYTSSLHALAQGILDSGRTNIRPKVVVTNAEPIDARQRREISQAFGCPVRETYGMAELGAAAGECSSGSLHVWPDVGILEVLDDQGQPVKPGETGELVVTGLLNDDMPLVRYRVGDRGALAEETTLCDCGRPLPRIARLEGRSDDILYSSDGRKVGRLDPVFKADFPIREAQIIQETLDRVRVRLVPAEGFDETCERSIEERLRERLGSMTFVFERVSQVPREPNGKFRAVLCRISPKDSDSP